MKKITLILLILALSGSFAFGQKVLLDKHVIQHSRKWGQNKSHWMHFYGAFGFITPINQSTTSPIYYGKSNNWELGLRYKKRITNFLAIGSNISYDFYNYRIEQSIEKTFPDKQFYDKQKLGIHNISLQPYIRISYGRRGNIIGKYIDFGFFYNAIMSGREKNFGTPSGLDMVLIKNPSYLSSDYYGFFTNISFTNMVIYAKYRYYQIIKTNSTYSDLPPLTIGVQIGFF